eukprot:164583_1
MADTQSKWRTHLNSLKSMGFKFPDNILIRHLEKFEGNMSSVIEKLLQDMKHIKIKPVSEPKVVKEENKDYEWWLYPMLFIIIFPVIISILISTKNVFYGNHDFDDFVDFDDIVDIGSNNNDFHDFVFHGHFNGFDDIISTEYFDVTYNILWITNSNSKNTITQHHFATNNYTLAQIKSNEYALKYGPSNVYCPELFNSGFYPKSETVINFALEETLVSKNDIVIHFSADHKNDPIFIEYGVYAVPKMHGTGPTFWRKSNNSFLFPLSQKFIDYDSIYYDINDIDILFDFIIEANERDILIDIRKLIFISYIKDNKMITAAKSKTYSRSELYEYPYIETQINGNIWGSDMNGLNHNQRLKLFGHWLVMEEKLQKIQDLYYNKDNNVYVVNWLRRQLLNDKQIHDDKVRLFVYYLRLIKDINNAYDLAVFREVLLKMKNENDFSQMRNEFMKEMRFKNVMEMKLFIESVIIYMYEMPLWIVGKYECLKYNNSIYQNDYHFVEILHDRNNIGNYIWKTKIGQIWSLEKIDDELLIFDVGENSNYYGFNGYTQMLFVMDESEYKIHAAIGQEFEKYTKQREL